MNLIIKFVFFLRKIVKDSNGTNIYQIVSIRNGINLYDFNTNSKVTIMSSYLNVMCPVELLKNANGVLINGLDGNLSRKKRQIRENNKCEIVCKRLMKVAFESKLNREFERCLNDCNFEK